MCKVFNKLGLILLVVLLSACGGTTVKTTDVGISSSVQSVGASSSQKKAFKQALDLMQEKDYAKASSLLETIVQENDRLKGAYINLGIAYTELTEYEKAEKALLNALKLDPMDIIAHNRLGLTYRRMGRFSDAKLSYERALQLNPEYAFGHRNLGILCDIYMQNYECALKHFEKYQLMGAAEDDKQIEIWLADLKRRIQSASN